MTCVVALVMGLGLWFPGQAGALTLGHVRSTYGILGPSRPDNKLLPGDQLCLAFDVRGMKPDADGRVRYLVGLTVADAQGSVKFKQEPRERDAVVTVGATQVPAFVNVQVGLDQPPGDYQVTVTIGDLATKARGSLTRSYTVLPKAFGLVRPVVSGDIHGQVPLAVVIEGQPFWVNFAAVGYTVAMGGQPSVNVSLRVLNGSGQPALAKPFTGEVTKDVPAGARAVPMQFGVDLGQAGNYTLELAATDRNSGKQAKLTLPLKVLRAD